MSTSPSITDLQNALLQLVRNANVSLDDINKLLDPAPVTIGNPALANELNQLLSILLQDRDGNSTFNLNDLKILSHDPIALTSLISTILLIVGSLPNINLQYDSNGAEIFILKLLAYIFLVVIPQKTNVNWSIDDKVAIVNISIIIIATVQSSQTFQVLIAKISAWLKSKGWCQCGVDAASVKVGQMQKNLPKTLVGLKSTMPQIKQQAALHSKLDNLLDEIKSIKSQK